MDCEHLEGCYNSTRVRCWNCDSPICLGHSNRVHVPRGMLFVNEGKGMTMKRRVCDNCLNGEVRP